MQRAAGLRGVSAPMLAGETHYKLMRMIEANPEMSQRDVARELGISLGKVNYSLRALIKKGWIKATNFKNSNNKAAYMYLLTPRGIEEKASLSVRFLRIKMQEYERLRVEIEDMRREAAERGSRWPHGLREPI
jgi:EPS-associated MarR family transcriptional regulator